MVTRWTRKLGRRGNKKGRDVNGILVLNKPLGVTSNAALQRVKRMFGAAKAGHTGSLDPLATGLLPLCFGEATKFSQILLDANKSYLVTGKLGVQTASGDTDGEVVKRCSFDDVTRQTVLDTIPAFLGEIEQVPSMYSALKHEGQPLYKLARQGIEVERKARKISIFKLELLSFEGDEFSLAVRCSKGTYIRNLVEDMGAAMGTCAHVIKLHRTDSGPYSSDMMVSFEALDEALEKGGHVEIDRLLKPIDSSVADWPSVELSETTAYYLNNGQSVQVPNSPVAGMVKLSLEDGTFLGIGEILDDGKVAPRRLLKTS
ncbi:tRNA pseudouridine(55) synthase TruB [Gammaproteobacteria bacterium 45_16_T64]|nr:tRNA pseudouridine(55) synthase TruB [Gammaproteobacteria bacterium 45_16_T64]